MRQATSVEKLDRTVGNVWRKRRESEATERQFGSTEKVTDYILKQRVGTDRAGGAESGVKAMPTNLQTTSNINISHDAKSLSPQRILERRSKSKQLDLKPLALKNTMNSTGVQ